MSYEYVKNSRHNLKRRLLYIMGDKCCICGYDKCTSALEFHHLNPDEKEFSLGANANIGFEKANEEIKKCILVCSNCHREIHELKIDVTNLSSYNEEKAKQIQQELKDFKTKKIRYCKSCGKIISSDAEFCVDCFNISQRRCERPNREKLKELIRTNSFVSIGSLYQVTDNAIKKWCKSMNLPSTKKEIKKYTDEEWKLI